jgi:hypothetical protein
MSAPGRSDGPIPQRRGAAAALAHRRMQLLTQADTQRARLAGSVAQLQAECAPERLVQRLLQGGVARGLAAVGAAGLGRGGNTVRWMGLAMLAWRCWRLLRASRR